MRQKQYLISEIDEFFYNFYDDFIWEESFPECYADSFVCVSFLRNIGEYWIGKYFSLKSQLRKNFLTFIFPYCDSRSCEECSCKRLEFIYSSTDAQREISDGFSEEFCYSCAHRPEGKRRVTFFTFSIEQSSTTYIDMLTLFDGYDCLPE